MYEDNPYLKDPDELLHFRKHLTALANYTSDNQHTFRKVDPTQLNNNLFITNMLHKRADKLEKMVNLNQEFLSRLSPKKDENPVPSTSAYIGKVRSTLRQFYREWCEESEERLKYLQLIELFKKYKEDGKVLIPGCGLGRIVLEFVRAGYAAEGNEVSYFMLFGSQFILNSITTKNSIEIAPFIHNLSGYRNTQDALRTVRIPDLVAFEEVNQDSDFSMKAGEFIQVYSEDSNKWDGVVTCFFIDTAMNVFSYVDTIFRLLKEGGVWVNYGPLLYHFRQNLKEQSVQVSWETLKEYVEVNFQIVEESIDETTYCHDPLCNAKLVYRCGLFVAIKKTKEGTQQKKGDQMEQPQGEEKEVSASK